jgi:D-glycero-alpha-D-manno-heptose 1-phosphate guanylyltransferase
MSFREKGFSGSGYINGGMYVVNRSIFYNMSPDRAFSFETDILEKSIRDIMILPYASKGYFIDIGTPEDYRKAEIELSGQLDTAK